MPPELEALRQRIAAVTIPLGGANYSVDQYFQLAPEIRADDEADVVDMRLTRVLLAVLGYEDDHDWEYNRTKSGGRPDFVVAPEGRISFFIEDKRTSTPLDLSQLEGQLTRYAESLSVLGLAFNGREALAVRLASGRLSPLVRVDLFAAARLPVPTQLPLDPEEHEIAFNVLVDLFHRRRFVGLQDRLRTLACPEAEWLAQANDINSSIDSFGEHAARLIVRLSYVAYTTLVEHLQLASVLAREMDRLRTGLQEYVRSTPTLPTHHDRFLASAEVLIGKVGRLLDADVAPVAELLANRARATQFSEQVRAVNSEARTVELQHEESLEVLRRYERWRDLEHRFEASLGETEETTERERRWRFARQCAYVLFLRILLIRILEDKGLLAARLITDGGLALWTQTVRCRFATHLGELSGAPLIDLALGQAEAITGSLHRRDVYDWYMPADASLLDVLEVLHRYNFSHLATDVIGYTYQRFLEETERHRLGHYLTPPAVVDHILDVANYKPENLAIIGRDVLDPACGSGSFLVHAAVRYRSALRQAYAGNEPEACEAFIHAVQQHFIGIDINPFSCYLARINLLVQSLDDIAQLRRVGRQVTLGEVPIYNGDSLDFAGIAGEQHTIATPLGSDLVRFKLTRAGQIQYLFANPPYINVKQENLHLADIQASQFYANWLHGDANTFLLFLRVGLHFVAPNGSVAFIVPSGILGDQQAERFRRRSLQDGFHLRHVTRFYTERVLFKPVEQATSVVVFSREAGGTTVMGGGAGSSSIEAMHDVAVRPVLQLDQNRTRVWLSGRAIPTTNPANRIDAAPWMLLWPVVPERIEYYDLWDAICHGSQLTVHQLFVQLGLADGTTLFRQGDVNTTRVRRFHVDAADENAMPLYKGEEIDQLIPLLYAPSRGPRGRTPYVAPVAQQEASTPERAVLAELDRIATLQDVEHGLVLHEVAKFRVPRRISGTYFERGPGLRRPVFPHTVWVAQDFPSR
jgi:SAM-dependent methyltransferase